MELRHQGWHTLIFRLLGIHLTQVGPTDCGLGYFRLMAESTICL